MSTEKETFSDAADKKPKTFELGDVTFTAKPFVQGIVLMDFLEASDGGGVTSIVAFKNFLKDSLEEDEWKKLDNHLRTSDKEIDIVEISKAVGDLVQAYTSRPTEASAQ